MARNIINGFEYVDQPLNCLVQIDSSNQNIKYIGYANYNVATSEAKWRIMRVYEGYDSNSSSATEISFADNNPDFDNVWDDRESLDYNDLGIIQEEV